MLRKTITIDEHLFLELQKEGAFEQFKNFSDLVSNSLRTTVEAIKRERYKKELEKMSRDPLVQSDISGVTDDFAFVDGELSAL
ncbi:MAG: hypothetical protein JXK05_14510 [Campylobacterales bacterium]|nr:hypothetical protein [Campylobacterales bacterium]